MDLFKLGLIRTIKRGDGLDGVSNLTYLAPGGEFTCTKDEWHKPKVTFPPQAWKALFDSQTMGRTVQLRTTSGCPFSCNFCTYPVTAGGFFKGDVAEFERQLTAIAEIPGIEAVILIDDTPNIPVKRFRGLVEVFKKFPFRWYSFLRVQYMDEQLAKDMAESGCDGVYLGIESANDTVLTAMNKKVRVAQYRDGIKMLRSNGIKVFAAFVLGFPGETRKSIDDNIRFIQETGLDFYSLKEFYYSHTAPIHKQREKWGLSGSGNRWKHNTMSSEEASSEKLRIFESVRTSSHLDADSGLWALAYLRDRGFTWPEIEAILDLISEMMRRDNRGEFTKKKDLVVRLKEILAHAAMKGQAPGESPAGLSTPDF